MRSRIVVAALLASGAVPSLAATSAAATATSAPAPAPAKAARPALQLELPLLSESSGLVPVATVDDEVIQVRDLLDALAQTHEERSDAKGAAHDFHPVLERLIDSRLIVLEAREMGLDESDEFKAAIEEYRRSTLLATMKREATKDEVADEMEVQMLVREKVREWNVRSALFTGYDDALAASEALKSGKPFDEVVKPLVAAGKAKGGEAAAPLTAGSVVEEVAEALRGAEAGTVTAPVKVQEGYAVLLVESVSYPENPEARASATRQSLKRKRDLALHAFYDGLLKKYAVVNRKLLAGLDLQSKKRFDQALKDRRAVVTITGEAPITVADLATEIRKKYFHGVDGPIRDKKVNEQVLPLLDDLLAKRLFMKEALARGLDRTETFRRDVDVYSDTLLFGRFVEKAIVPSVKVTEGDGLDYYEKHKGEYAYPGMYRLDGIGFTSAKAAQSALEKLKGGADLRWVRANVDGVVPADEMVISLEGRLVSAKTLPAELAAALSGARAGDYRLYTSAGQSFVITVADVTSPGTQEYPAVRTEIVSKLFREKMGAAIKEYATKLRASHRISVFLTRIVE